MDEIGGNACEMIGDGNSSLRSSDLPKISFSHKQNIIGSEIFCSRSVKYRS